MPNEKCTYCGKTVYPLEALSAIEKTWHKGCFRCQAEGCTVLLNLKTYFTKGGVIYCKSHVPKDTPASVLDMATYNAKNSPKVSTVNNQVLLSYDQAKNTGSLSLSESNAKAAPKVGPINEQVRLKYEDAKNSGSLSFSEQNAMNAPKKGVVNEQVRLKPEDSKNTGALSLADNNAKNAPKVGVVNNEVRLQNGTLRGNNSEEQTESNEQSETSQE